MPVSNTAPAAAQLAELSGHLAAMNALRALRDSDPAALLQQAAALPATWQAIAQPPQRHLLEASRQLLIAGAHFWLGDMTAFSAAMAVIAASLEAAQGVPAEWLDDCRMQHAHMAAYHADRQGRYDEAFKGYLNALQLARASRQVRYQVVMLKNLGGSCEEAGLFDESLVHLREALSLAVTHGLTAEELDIHHNLGNALAGAGDREAALASFGRARAGFDAAGATPRVSAALVGMAEQQLELGRPDEAMALLQQMQALPQHLPLGPAYAAALQARALQALGRWDDARDDWNRSLSLYAARDEPPGQARAHTGLANVARAQGRLESAAEHVAQALSLVGDRAARRECMAAHEAASLVHEARGDPARALGHAREHHAVYQALFHEMASRRATLLAIQHSLDRAQADAQRHALENRRLNEALAEVAARLQQLSGARALAPSRGPEALRGLGLTPREAEVLYWVCEGKSNEDVAAIVGTGMAAVKKNLVRIYDKLGVENRTSAAAEVRRRGLA